MKKIKVGKHEGLSHLDDTRAGIFVYQGNNPEYFYVSKIFKIKNRNDVRLERRGRFPYEKKTVLNSVSLPIRFIPHLIDLLQEFYKQERGITKEEMPQHKEDKELEELIGKVGI